MTAAKASDAVVTHAICLMVQFCAWRTIEQLGADASEAAAKAMFLDRESQPEHFCEVQKLIGHLFGALAARGASDPELLGAIRQATHALRPGALQARLVGKAGAP